MKPISFTKNGANIEVSVVNGRYRLKYPCGSDKTSCSPYFANIPPGRYRFVLHGASGGTSNQNYYGSGGYSEGIISFRSTTPTYFYVGAEGTIRSDSKGQTQSSFNGGGKGYNYDSTTAAGSGGGGTDIRLFLTSLNNRILVAGGGGGTGYLSGRHIQGGSGGGSKGMKGEDWDSNLAHNLGGEGGTQISGGSSYYEDGTFGYGADKASSNGCGGGGGWFGGGSGGAGLSAGGGGSGFVFNSTNPNIALDSRYYVYKGITRTGTNKGDGIIEIEPLSTVLSKLHNLQNQINSNLIIIIFSLNYRVKVVF